LKDRGAPGNGTPHCCRYGLGAVTVSVNEQRPPPTVYVYVPAAMVESSVSTLGPFALAPFERLTLSELHFVKESFASASPAPTLTVKVRAGLPGFSEPENVTVWVLAGAGGGAGGAAAAKTIAVCVDVAVAEPALFEAVTVTRSVEPTSAVCTA
jgi:hypothetical protein